MSIQVNLDNKPNNKPTNQPRKKPRKKATKQATIESLSYEGKIPIEPPKWEKWAQCVAQGVHKVEAYRECIAEKPTVSDGTCRGGVSNMLRSRPDLRARLAFLMGEQTPPMPTEEPSEDDAVEAYDLTTLDGYKRFLHDKATNLDTRDPDAIKAAIELARISDIQSARDEERRKVDPARICDALARGRLGGKNPAQVFQASVDSLDQAAQVIAEIFGFDRVTVAIGEDFGTT